MRDFLYISRYANTKIALVSLRYLRCKTFRRGILAHSATVYKFTLMHFCSYVDMLSWIRLSHILIAVEVVTYTDTVSLVHHELKLELYKVWAPSKLNEICFIWCSCVWYIEGVLPKGPYLPCASMAGRALWQDTLDMALDWQCITFHDQFPVHNCQPIILNTTFGSHVCNVNNQYLK